MANRGNGQDIGRQTQSIQEIISMLKNNGITSKSERDNPTSNKTTILMAG
jgi:hypothetical protein